MEISACIITKNEEHTIKTCIESFNQIVSEIILVDTGSTDRTVEIAKSLGVTVYSYKWDNDFSNPRNYALDQATGDWIIFLDADEYFYKKSAMNIPKILKNIPSDINGLVTKRINIDTTDGKVKNTDYMLRIFRKNSQIRYSGNIHENVFNNGALLNAIATNSNELVIYHTGYSTDIIKSKFERNLELLLNNVEIDQTNNMTLFYLADCYMGVGQYELAIEYVKKFIDSGQGTLGFNSKPYLILINSMMRMNYDFESIMSEILCARGKFPNHPIFTECQASLYYDYSMYTESLKLYMETLKLQEKYNDLETNSIPAYLYKIYYYIGLINKLKGDYEQSIEFLFKSLSENKYFEDALHELIYLIKSEDPIEIINLLNSIYKKNDESELNFLVKHLSKLKLGKVLMYFWNKRYNNKGEEDSYLMFMYLSNGLYNDAFKYFSRCYEQDKSDWTSLYTVLSSILSRNIDNINYAKENTTGFYKKFIHSYLGNKEVFNQEDLQIYIKFLEQFLLLDADENILKTIDLKHNFSNDISYHIAQKLMEYGFNAYAIQEFNCSLRNNTQYNKGDILFKLGVCNFELKKDEQAAKYFSNSLITGYYKNDIFEYLKWIKEYTVVAELQEKIDGILTEYEIKRETEYRLNDIRKKISSIQGWINDSAGAKLYELARFLIPTPVVVEIGSWKGRSTAWLAFAIKDSGKGKVIAVDTWEGSINEGIHKKMLADYSENQLFNEFKSNMSNLNLLDYIQPIKMDSIGASKLVHEEIGLLFIDAAHDYISVRKDFEFWAPKVKVGGFIVFDDVPSWPGPTRLVSELPRWYKQVAVSPNNWIVQKLE